MPTFKTITVLGALIALCGCRALCPPAEMVIVHDTTTVETKVTYRDTAFIAPASQVTYTITGPTWTEDFKPILKTNKNAKLTAQVLPGNRLVMGCYCDSVLIRAQMKDVLTRELKSKYKEIHKPPSEVLYIPGWVKFLAWVGAVCIALMIILIVLKFYKP